MHSAQGCNYTAQSRRLRPATSCTHTTAYSLNQLTTRTIQLTIIVRSAGFKAPHWTASLVSAFFPESQDRNVGIDVRGFHAPASALTKRSPTQAVLYSAAATSKEGLASFGVVVARLIFRDVPSYPSCVVHRHIGSWLFDLVSDLPSLPGLTHRCNWRTHDNRAGHVLEQPVERLNT